MHHEEHAKSCESKYGISFIEIHKFLDQYAPHFGHDHQILFHHNRGIELICKKFGPSSRKAAELHITEDLGFVPEDPSYFQTDNEELIELVRKIYYENT